LKAVPFMHCLQKFPPFETGKVLIVRSPLAVVLEVPPDANEFLTTFAGILESAKDLTDRLMSEDKGFMDSNTPSVAVFAENIIVNFF